MKSCIKDKANLYICDLSGEGVSDEKVIVTEYYTILHTD